MMVAYKDYKSNAISITKPRTTYKPKTYPFKVPRLQALHSSMRELGIYVHVFDFAYNGVVCKAIFQTDSKPYTLTFVKIPAGQIFTISILLGYRAELTPGKQETLKKFFGVNSEHRGHFQYKDFINYLDGKIPARASAGSTGKNVTGNSPMCPATNRSIALPRI